MKKFIIGFVAAAIAVGFVIVIVIFLVNAIQANHKKDLSLLIQSCIDKDELSSAKNLTERALLQYPADDSLRSLHTRILEEIKEQENSAIVEKPTDPTIELKQQVKTLSNKLDRYIALSAKSNSSKLETLTTITPANPKDDILILSLETKSQVESLTADSIKAYKNGNTSYARKQLVEVLKVDEDNPQANVYYAACLFKENPDSAENKKLIIKSCQTAMKKDTSIELAHFLLARTYQAQGKFDLSIQEYKQTLTLDPENYEASYYLGKVLYDKGEYEEATRFLLTALKLKSNWTDALYYLALSCERQGNKMEAKKYLNQICEQDNTFYSAFKKLGDICYTDKDYEAALRAYLGANRINPNSQSYLNVARCYYGLNKNNEAETALLEAVKLDSNNYDALYLLCESYLNQNKKTEAKKYYDLLMAKAPSYKSEQLIAMKKKFG